MRALIAALFAASASPASASASASADGDVCDTGSLKGAGALCVVTKKHTVTQAAIEFEGSLMIRGQGALATPISGGEHALSVRGTGPNSAIVLRDEGSIQASNLTVEATQIHLWNSSSLNATMRPDPEDEAGDSTRSTLQVRATHAHARIESIVLANRSSINAARVNISTKGILVIGTNPPPAAPSASRWYSTIDTSGVQPTTRDGMSSPPQGAGGGYAGRGANCGSDELGGAPYGAVYGKGQCRDGVPGGAATTGVPGGAGGGQVIISASRLVLDGVITADGGAGQSASPGGIPPGGGSGGCVFLNLASSESDHSCSFSRWSSKSSTKVRCSPPSGRLLASASARRWRFVGRYPSSSCHTTLRERERERGGASASYRRERERRAAGSRERVSRPRAPRGSGSARPTTRGCAAGRG